MVDTGNITHRQATLVLLHGVSVGTSQLWNASVRNLSVFGLWFLSSQLMSLTKAIGGTDVRLQNYCSMAPLNSPPPSNRCGMATVLN